MEESAKKSPRSLNPNYYHQIQILRCLSAVLSNSGQANSGQASSSQPRALSIVEITQMIGLEDEKETQRHLFILEGSKLVSPQPPGDFTSKVWQITREGMDAVKMINNSVAA